MNVLNSLRLVHVERPGRRIAYFHYWLRSINNIRYDELLPRLGCVTHYQVLFSNIIPVRWLQFRIWWKLSTRVIYPIILPRIRRLHHCLFSTDTRQTKFFEGRIILDLDDPPYTLDSATVTACNRDNVAVVVVTTEPIKQHLLKYGVKCPILVIPQGVSLRDFSLQRAQEISVRYKGPREIAVGFASPGLYLADDIRNGDIRRQMDCLDEFLTVMTKARLEVPELTAWLFGHPSRSLNEYAQRRPWIRLFGYIPHSELFNYVANFDIAVYPRRVDLGGRFSMKLAECMTFGIPVVSTDVSESFVVTEAGGGIVVESAEDFARALVSLAKSPEMRRSLGEAARSFGQGLDWDVLAERYRREVFDVYAAT